MQRIAASLVGGGYHITLVGRTLPHSTPLDDQPFSQKRLSCWFQKGMLFYAEYNIRLFFYLLFAQYDAVCSVDFDTLPGGCSATLLRGKKRVFDAHEYFTEVPEVTHRKMVKAIWYLIGKTCLPFYKHAYTVGPALADIFTKQHGIPFGVIRNVGVLGSIPVETRLPPALSGLGDRKMILYQGALNEGRGLEAMIESIKDLTGVVLVLAGEGDLSQALRAQVDSNPNLQDKVIFLGFVKPSDLKTLTQHAWVGINLLENKGLSYYYSLANKFFDYVQAEKPCVTMNFPEYTALNQVHEVAILLPDLHPLKIKEAITRLQDNKTLYLRLKYQCAQAKLEWNWEWERGRLLEIWAAAMGDG